MLQDRIACKAGCGKTVTTEEEALAASWEYLPISGGFRCNVCTRELRQASTPTSTHTPVYSDKPNSPGLN